MENLKQRNHWVDNVRTFITLLVVGHHSAVAYATFSVFDRATYINSTHPVVDRSKWIGMDVFANFNDIFFMPLMFLISGLFLFKGLKKKGTARFLLDRGKRLGIPFVLAELFVIPVAYIPSYYIANHQNAPGAFISDYLFHQQWPVGPPWFIWLLLAFTVVAALLPPAFFTGVSAKLASLSVKPGLFFVVFAFAAGLTLIPLSLWIGPYAWTGFGPFDFQLNRVIFYFLFFIFGAVLGAGHWESYLFRQDRLLDRSSMFWLTLTVISFGMVELMTFWGNGVLAAAHVPEFDTALIFQVVFVLTSVITCLACLAVFRKYGNISSPLTAGLSSNAYGIYLFHYVFLTWTQYFLLGFGLPVIIKFVCVFLVSLGASWYMTHLLRKISAVRDII